MEERLTPEEIKLASKYINKCERNSRSLKYLRWVILFLSLALIILSFKLLMQSQEFGKMNTTEYLVGKNNSELNILDRHIDARLKGEKLKTDLLSQYVDIRMDMLRLEFTSGFRSYLGAIMGGLMLGFFVTSWFWRGRNRLIIKGLRMLISLSESENDQKDKIT